MAKTSTVMIKDIMKRHQPSLEQYRLNGIVEISHGANSGGDEFQKGSYGSIIELDWNGTRCVGKILHESFFDVYGTQYGMEFTLNKFCQEIRLLSRMKHSNIVQFFGIHYSERIGLPVLVMERLECSVTKFLETHEKGTIAETVALGILFDVSKGLVYLHEVEKVAHRDLSSNNILLTANMCAKIADLGSARELDIAGGWNYKTSLTMQPGTQDFMPPETLEDPPRYTVSVDVFSFGCVIIHLITHQWPRAIGKAVKGKLLSEYERRKKTISIMGESHDLIPLVKMCLEDEDHANDKSRPTSKYVMSFIQKVIESIPTEK